MANNLQDVRLNVKKLTVNNAYNCDYFRNVATTAATGVTAYSVPVPINSSVWINVTTEGATTDGVTQYQLQGSIDRAYRVTGNITAGTAAAIFTTYTSSASITGIAFTANNTTYAVDISVGGLASTAMTWSGKVEWGYNKIV